jgi:hypothetical protein
MSGLVPKVMLTAATVAVIAVVTGALFVLDSPAVAAEKKRDLVLADDLSCMERQIARKYRDAKALPAAGEVAGFACLNHGSAPSGVRYTPTGADTYRLCATFRYPAQGRGMDSDHPAGEYCMNRNAGAKD